MGAQLPGWQRRGAVLGTGECRVERGGVVPARPVIGARRCDRRAPRRCRCAEFAAARRAVFGSADDLMCFQAKACPGLDPGIVLQFAVAPVLVLGFAADGLATALGASTLRALPQGSVGPWSGMLPSDRL